jgi:hypothetical protein
MATEVNKILLELEFDSKGVIINLDQVQAKLKAVGVDLAKAGKQFQDFGKAAKNGSSAAGIAGAAAAELGRTISDLPYGINAITNNVSQLGSMFSLLVVKTGSAKEALKELLKVFKGPAGFLIVFQIAVAALELFTQKKELQNITDPKTIDLIREKYRVLSESAALDFKSAVEGIKFEKVPIEIQPMVSFKDLIDPPQTEAQKWASKQLEIYNKAIEGELVKREESKGERNFFLDTFGVSEENLQAGIAAAQTALNTLGDVFSAQAEREIAVETNRTNQLNDQLRQRLANEQLSADERDKINQEIARNEAQLVAKENQINKKRFEQEKAVNIALATVNTFSAATGVLAETKGGTFARIAGMIAVIGAGLAQVAIIAKQQFTAKAMPSPNLSGLGGAGGGGAEPQFNVIGATGQNQLAAAIAATQQQPVKAYVVSNDVTTAQSLDRNIVAEASL